MSNREPVVLGFGVITVDDILYVDAVPPPGGRARVRERRLQAGGNVACALATASRLGVRASFIGRLSEDRYSSLARAELKECGVDLSYVLETGGAGLVLSTILVRRSTGERTVFSDRNRVVPVRPDELRAEWFDGPRVLMIDYLYEPTALRAVKLAKAAGMEVVSDFEHEGEVFREVIPHVDHFICGEQFALPFTGCDDPVEAVRRMRAGEGHRVVAVTVGENGCYWSTREDDRIYHQPAMKVQAADTTGCGDVFRGAYCYGLFQGWDVKRSMVWSTVAAGLMASKTQGWAGIPTAGDVKRSLVERPLAEARVVDRAEISRR